MSGFLAPLWRYIIGVLALLGGGLGFYIKGRRDQNKKDKRQDAYDREQTRKRMDEVGPPADDAAARDWLRKRSDKRGL